MLLVATPVYAEISAKKYLVLKEASNKTPETELLLTTYISGVGSAYTFANAMLESEGQSPLFCVPRKLALNTGNFTVILDNTIEKLSTIADTEDLTVSLLILQGLIATFPCDKK